MPFVFDAATAPAEARQPDPDRAVPPCLGKVLGLVRTLIAYGKHLTDTLRQHADDPRVLPCFAFVARIFGTRDLAPILARISRGLLRAAALEERLRQRAARGEELQVTPTRLPRHKLHAGRPAAPPHDPAQHPSLANQPTIEEILAKDRRRPIGAVLVDICLDLGIAPAQMSEELRLAIILYDGNLCALIGRPERWRLSDDPAAIPDDSPIDGPPIIAFPPWPAPPEQPPPLAEGLSREADQCPEVDRCREADRWRRGPDP